HFAGQTGVVDHLDHDIDVLVGGRLLFRESLPGAGVSDDSVFAEFALDLPAVRLAGGRATAQHAARTMAGAAERLLHAARLTDQHPTGPAHVTGNDDRLTDVRVGGRRLRMKRRKRPRRPPAVHADGLLPAVDAMLLELGDD